MKTEGKKWFAGLRTFIGECREKCPIVERAVLSAEDENQCQIIGGSLLAWLQKHGPPLIQERAVLSKLQKWEKDPFIVFTSEQTGLVAAKEILGEERANIAFLAPFEFSEWLKFTLPDPVL